MAPRRVRSYQRVRRGVSRTLGRSAALALILPWVPHLFGTILGVSWLVDWSTPMLAVGFFLAPLLALVSPVVGAVASRTPTTIEVDAGDLVYTQGEKRRRIPRAEIESGVFLPSAKSPTLEIDLRGGDVLRITVDDERTGEQLLDELGIGPTKRRARVELAETTRRWLLAVPAVATIGFFWFIMLGFAVQAWERNFEGSLPLVFAGPLLAGFLGTFLAWQRLRRPHAVEIGSDGVELTTALDTRFVPYRDIAKVWADKRSLFVREHDGRVTRISGGFSIAGPEDGAHAAPSLLGAVRRIEEARRMQAAAAEGTQLATMLARGGRSVPEWKKELARVLEPGTSYRAVSVTPEEVEKILDDASAPAGTRIGAALALRAAAVPGARDRIRIAAGLTSKDELRFALERVAEQEAEDEALEEAIHALAAESENP
jgi:hypothetical protein